MTALRSIVVATDLSAPAQRAADRAAMLAQAASAALLMVHAVSGSALDDLRRWLDTGGDPGLAILEEARGRLHGLATELAARHQIVIDDLTVTGQAVDEIVRIAVERQADLVVTGTLGGGLIRHLPVGSTAERIVKRSSTPVLMVRQVPREPYRRVLIAVDFSAWSAPSIKLAAAVAPEAELILVHAVEMPFEGKLRFAGVAQGVIDEHQAVARGEAARKLRELAEGAAPAASSWTPLTSERDPAWMQIVRKQQEEGCDLIVVGKHGRNALEDLLLGSTTNRIIGESTSDVLVSAHHDA